MNLITKAERDTIGIDSFERAIIFSVLLLRKGYVSQQDTSLRDYFQFTLSTILDRDSNLVRGKFDCRGKVMIAINALDSGLDLVENIIESVSDDIPYTGGNITASEVRLAPITTEPAKVVFLEQYFYWACTQLLVADLETYYTVVAPLPTYTNSNQTTELNVVIKNLYFDLATFFTVNNLIASLGVSTTVGDSQINNDTQISNDFQFSN